MELKGIELFVQGILLEDAECRESDEKLYWSVVNKVMDAKGMDASMLSARELVVSRWKYGIPAFESVRRSRQKIQSEYPELRGHRIVRVRRNEMRKVYEQYVKGA